MRMIKYMFLAYKTLAFNLLRGCCSFSKTRPLLKSSTSKMTVHAPWNQLPNDIWSSIFERLGLEDRLRFDLVCKQWRSNIKRTPQLLWLMLPYDRNSQYLSFFDMCEGKIRKFNLPGSAQGGWFSGCSKGWLFLVTGMDVDDLRIFLFDPISRSQIPLPPLSTISSFKDSFTARHPGWNPAACIINGVEISSSDASQCIVVIKFSINNRILALCRPQDERWTIVEGLLGDEYYYGNFSFFDGELYACILSSDKENNNQDPCFQTHSIILGSQRVNLKLISSTPPPTNLIFAADADESILYYKDSFRWPYLVESNGQLLVVTQVYDRIMDLDDSDSDSDSDNDNDDGDRTSLFMYFQAATFQVKKIQTIDDTLHTAVLTDVGNQSLFVGAGDCLAVKNCDKLYKNCIYFLHDMDYSLHKQDYPLISREAGVYYLEDGSIQRCLPSIKTQNHCLYMFWFSPNIKSRVLG
ncbi:hypothetical protein ES288_A05G304800v1 [Gossypium darwinii]|uniref:F-box domain-containing protein n=1 Tax=Gossypium darwinii TaxID=34276 RepID=A0A5D2GMN7_GOSDA|nr:hypothetical protein ES288_A05G304800v1 [Gossypium darwinii]